MAREHIDRKTLKEDAFRDVMFDLADVAYRHRKTIAALVAGLVVIALTIGGYFLYVRYRAEKLAERFYAAESVLTDAKGDGTVDNVEARKAFQAIADDFPRARLGAVAQLFVARLAWELQDPTAAEAALKSALAHKGGDAGLRAMANLGLAHVMEQRGSLAEAETYYKALPDPTFQDLKAVGLGRLALARHNPAEARKLYEEVAKRYPPNGLTEWAKTVLSYLP
ncbi:MAG: tetratricopeptide repeat protein [Candidatus Lambdaproteobacteria bacterium]|nr:tetratricopeptide repeat protein [Candidatus Lambdaproteobacteria bacterium]